MNFIYYPIIPNTNFMERVFPFHFGCYRVWELFSQAVNSLTYSFPVSLRNFLKCFCSGALDLNPIFQSSSSFFNSSQGIGCPGSFFAFHASSISILSSISCSILSSFIETRAAMGSPRRVRTKDSSPYATLFIIFENFFLASAVVILFNINILTVFYRQLVPNVHIVTKANKFVNLYFILIYKLFITIICSGSQKVRARCKPNAIFSIVPLGLNRVEH